MTTRCRALWLCGSLVFLVMPQLGCTSAAKTPTQQAMTPHTYSVSMELSYWRDSGGRLYMPLWVEIPPSREIYRPPQAGIRIESVEVDGRRISATVMGLNDGFFTQMWPPLRVDEPFFVYQVEADTWDYALSKEEQPKHWTDYELLSARMATEGDWGVLAYRIPYDARRIKIEYRLRYPVDGRE